MNPRTEDMRSSHRKMLAVSLCLLLALALGTHQLPDRAEKAAVGWCPRVGTLPMPVACEPGPDLS